jgi:hypothetical protein
MIETTTGPETVDHDTGPLSRYWNAKNWSAGAGVDVKKVRRTKIEQIKKIITVLYMVVIRPTPNQKDSAGEHGTMSATWAGNVSTGLQESCGEIPR